MQAQNSTITKPLYTRIFNQKIIHVENESSNELLAMELQDAMIKYYQTLQTIRLPGNKLQIIGGMQIIYPQLIELDLSGNKIKFVFLDLPNIRSINLSKNQLCDFETDYNHPYLEILNLNNNRLSYLPAIKAPNLKQLYLGQNQIPCMKQFSKQQYPSLKVLTVNNNGLQGDFPQLNCPNLQYLDISSNPKLNSITTFCQKQYPEMKTFILRNINKLQYDQIDYQMALPQLHMPKLQTLIISCAHLINIQDFFKGIYLQLKTLEITSNLIWKTLVLYQLNAPNLRNISFQNTKVINISQFLMGDYKFLEKINLKNSCYLYKFLPRFQNKILSYNNTILTKIEPQDQALHQIEIYNMEYCGKNAHQFIKFTKLCYPFYKNLLIPFIGNVQVLKLDFKVIKSIEILFHLDIRNIKQIKIMNNHYLTSTYKNLTKINLCDQYLNNLQIFQFNQFQKPNIITFVIKIGLSKFDLICRYMNIERNQYWRRMGSDKKQINWKTVYSHFENSFVRDLQNYKSFQSRLLSLKYKKMRKIDSLSATI